VLVNAVLDRVGIRGGTSVFGVGVVVEVAVSAIELTAVRGLRIVDAPFDSVGGGCVVDCVSGRMCAK